MSHALTELAPERVKELHQLDALPNLLRFVLFVLLYAIGAAAAIAVANRTDGLMFLIYALPCWILAGASLHGISLFTHEAVHGTLCRNRWLNAIAGACCAWPVWQNYSAYRVLHLRHHDDLGGEHDPDHYANYTRWTWGIFTLNWLRLLVGYPVYITAIPLLGWKHGTARARVAILVELVCCALLFVALWYLLPMKWLLHAWLMPMIFINTMVNIRGMSQHTLLEHPDDVILGTRSILTSPVVRFFMCNENYHLEHHLYPGIPWYRLAQAHDMLAPELTRRGAPFIGSYSAFVWQFVRHSIKCGPWRK